MDAPLRPDERIASLDILRGLALLGMFVVHFHDHSTEPGGLDDVVRTLIWRLVESKSHGTFALLFGAGFAIQLRRAETLGRPFAGFYLRRLAVLALFGFAAHAFFGFNVLLGYAVWGVPLLADPKVVQSRAARGRLCLGSVCGALPPCGDTVFTARGGPGAVNAAYHARQAVAADVNGAVKAAEAQSSYTVLLAARLSHMAWFHAQPFFFMPGGTLALFIVGLLLVRHGVFEEPLAHVRVLGSWRPSA